SAEELREAIAQLTAPGAPGAPHSEEPLRLRRRVAEARDVLAGYEDRHRDTVLRQRDPDDGKQEDELIEDLKRFFRQFEDAVNAAASPKILDGQSPPLLADDPDVKTAQSKLLQAADLLRKAIYDDMYRRISIAKTHQRRSMII